MHVPTVKASRLGAAAATLLVLGCADTAPIGAPSFNHTGDPDPTLGHWVLCKDGTSATFDVSVNGAPSTVTLGDGACQQVAQTPAGGGVVDVTVTEQPQPGVIQLDSIVFDSTVVSGSFGSRKVTGTNTFTKAINGDVSAVVTFYNVPVPPPPPGGDGCTPGYWKQSQHFGSWTAPYTPSTQFSSVFDDAFPGSTLLQVVSQGGGGLNALGRHSVAALLNAASGAVAYGMTPAEVIDAFNAAFASGDYETQKNVFEGLNERTCPLARAE